MLALVPGPRAALNRCLEAAAAGCTYCVRVISRPNPSAFEQKSDTRDVLALAITKGIHEFAELGCALDLKEDLVVVIGDLDVEMFRWASIFRLLRW